MKNMDPNPSLPHEIREQLDASEISDTQNVWEYSAAYLSEEPSDEDFVNLGKDMWPAIQQATRPKLQKIVPWRHIRIPAAAVACIAILISIVIPLTEKQVLLTAPTGEQISHQLPDGSTVQLNSGTQLQYSRKFGHSSRELTLTGEAFLNVTPSSIPFVVNSFDAKTEVLGTSFNVRAWPDEISAATYVSVEEGQVRVIPLANEAMQVTLQAGQSARVQPTGQAPLITQTAHSNDYTWIHGGFKFSDRPLKNIAEEIERRYGVSIKIDSPSLASMSIGILKQSPENAEEIIRDICELHCDYRTVSGGFVLTSR